MRTAQTTSANPMAQRALLYLDDGFPESRDYDDNYRNASFYFRQVPANDSWQGQNSGSRLVLAIGDEPPG